MTDKWNEEQIKTLFQLPFIELIQRALIVHAIHFKLNEIELCGLLSIKTGACPEDCAYCPQSAHYHTGLTREKLLDVETVVAEAKRAKANGATRFCLGAAWRSPPKKAFPKIIEMIHALKKIDLELCMTLGMLEQDEAYQLHTAGLDFYNHNLDTSPLYYKKIITTRTYEDRLKTLDHVRGAGIHVCCGGIIGMGETFEDRVNLLLQLANLPEYPESVPINRLIPILGTPLAAADQIDNFDFIRTIVVARILMPKAVIRLSAGRKDMSEEMQTLCFMAGANSMWLGEKLLTAKNVETDKDILLFKKLGLTAKPSRENPCSPMTCNVD